MDFFQTETKTINAMSIRLPFLFGPQNCQYPPASGGFRVTNGHESIELVENRSQSPSPPGMMISHPQDHPLRGQCRESRSSSVILRRLSVNVTGPFRAQKKTFLKKQARPSCFLFSWHIHYFSLASLRTLLSVCHLN